MPTPIRRLIATLLALTLLLGAASAWLLRDTLELRYERDVSRVVFNDNVEFLEDLRRRVGLEHDSLSAVLASIAEPAAGQPYIVVSIEDHRLWYKQGDSVLFTTEVATGSGRILERIGSESHWRFETPRGRLTVVSKEKDPVWVPPDWHYVEEAQRRGLGIVHLRRGDSIPTPEGDTIFVLGADVVRREAGRGVTVVPGGEGGELVVGGNIVVPPFGTNQRKYRGVLGTHRLNLGDGYALHGTNKPETIGRSVSHGCIRLRNDDIAWLHQAVTVGTPVFVY